MLGTECKDLGQSPEILTPGRRDYVWTVDTLKTAPGDAIYPSRIWGGATNDVWLACFGSPITSLLWHFDGTTWKRDSTARAISPSALWGFASNDVWLGNTNNSFWRYNGAQWYRHSTVVPPAGFEITTISGIWGSRPNDVWAVGGTDHESNGGTGYKGIILHFNGVHWQYMSIPDIRIGFSDIRQQSSSELFFLYGYRFETTGDTGKVYIYDGRILLREIYTSADKPMYFESIRGEVYFISEQVIYKYHGGSLQIWKDFSGTQYHARMVGRSELDFFGLTRDNSILHYNGSNFEVLYNNTVPIWLAFVVGDSAFFVCEEINSGLTVIIRGKLQ